MRATTSQQLGERKRQTVAEEKRYKTGQSVQWSWGQGKGRGRVAEVFTERVTRTLEGAEVTRNADEENPAYLIEQEDGARVLKSHSELESAG